jgi:hypothetical protein
LRGDPGLGRRIDELACSEQFGFCVASSHEAIVAYSHKAGWKYMEEKSADEILGGDDDDPVFRRVGVVSGFEGNPAV